MEGLFQVWSTTLEVWVDLVASETAQKGKSQK
jgi:hypothetical protein